MSFHSALLYQFFLLSQVVVQFRDVPRYFVIGVDIVSAHI